MERKKFLRNAVGLFGVTAFINACKKDDNTSSTNNNGGCNVSATEEEGPFPYAGGEITNPLNRTDVTEGQEGIPLPLAVKVVNSNNNCSVVENARLDIWFCNKDGYYSGYGNQPGVLGTKNYVGETWLRGYQLSNAEGLVHFAGIYPGWYSGRATHIHYEVFMNGVLKKIGQMAFPESVSDVVHVSPLYALHGINTTRNTADHVFGNSATDLANETLAMSGDVNTGYTGSITIAIPF